MWQPDSRQGAADDWVQATATLPLAFAQVREDPWIDQQLVERLDRPARVLMIASGGETAALLSTLPLESLHLVDINPAQLNLTRLKLQLLQTADTQERLALLGYESMPAESRSQELSRRTSEIGIEAETLGPPELLAQYGPDYCGRYEWLFARLRQLLAGCSDAVLSLMQMSDPGAQTKSSAEGTELHDQLVRAFDEVMDLDRLIQIFGPDATANRVQPFSRHFLQQTLHALSAFPAIKNPFLHQIVLGRFIGPLWPWLECDRQERLPETRFSQGAMSDVLPAQPDSCCDLLHLSNILDWVTPDAAGRLLSEACRCLAPGGLVVIRQLNSRLDIRGLPCGIRWLPDLSQSLHDADRSFFYRSLHVGIKP